MAPSATSTLQMRSAVDAEALIAFCQQWIASYRKERRI